MINLLEQNLNILSKYNPELASKILNHVDLQANYEINPAKSGDNILYKDNIPVDDSMDPVWSSMEMYSKLEHNSKKSITVLLGLGLGYTFKEFAKRYKGKLILHEPNLEFLRIAFEIVDFSEELSKPNIIVTNTFDDIKNAFNDLFYKDYKYNFVASDYYLKDENLNLSELMKNLNNCYVTYEQTHNNLWNRNSMWSTLLFNNITKVVNNQDLHILKNKFKNKTAVIISAGPSLDKNIENLKPYRDKLIVFCVGVAFKAAVKHGITPDFVMVVDNDKEVINIPEISDVSLIASTYSNNNIFELKPKRFFNYHIKTTPACIWLAKVLGVPDMFDYESAGTVAINCLYSAKLMGCDKIILIGQDLAYTDNKCYSQSSEYAGFSVNESKIVEFKGELNQNKNIAAGHEQFLGRDLVEVKGLNNTKLLTRPDYYMFKLFFEDLAQKYASELELINATEGGAYIEGFKHITLNEALEKYTDEKINVNQVLNDFELTEHEIAKRKKKILKEFNLVSKNDKELKNFIFSGFKEGFLPYFKCDFETKYDYNQKKYRIGIAIKKTGEIKKLSPEEENVYKEASQELNQLRSNLKNDIEELFNNKPAIFSENLKIVKDKYLKMRNLLEINPYYKYLYFAQLLSIDHLIIDFDSQDEELKKLSFDLNYFFYSLYYRWPIYNEKMESIITELEK